MLWSLAAVSLTPSRNECNTVLTVYGFKVSTAYDTYTNLVCISKSQQGDSVKPVPCFSPEKAPRPC